MRTLALIVLFIFSLSALPARAADIAGDPCSTLGTTKLDAHKQNIIACLNASSGTSPVWKAMTLDNLNLACASNQYMTGVSNGKATCAAVTTTTATTTPTTPTVTTTRTCPNYPYGQYITSLPSGASCPVSCTGLSSGYCNCMVEASTCTGQTTTDTSCTINVVYLTAPYFRTSRSSFTAACN